MRHEIVSRDEWLAARTRLLAKEKAFTRRRDELTAERLALPWVRVEKRYVFDGPRGPETLADLFDGRSQLVVKHFMFGPDWSEGCVGCSFEMDQLRGALVHLAHHDVTFVAVARAPFERLEAFRRRMGWEAKFVSSYGSDFNHDFHVSFRPEDMAKGQAWYNYAPLKIDVDEMSGRSVFHRNEAGEIFHTYSSYARGGELGLNAYAILDITPKGRAETINGNMTDWVRHHDRYDRVGSVELSDRSVTDQSESCCHLAQDQEEAGG
jgi:predicted dithiol-disulfide oxidoreductase (DUF899 family)